MPVSTSRHPCSGRGGLARVRGLASACGLANAGAQASAVSTAPQALIATCFGAEVPIQLHWSRAIFVETSASPRAEEDCGHEADWVDEVSDGPETVCHAHQLPRQFAIAGASSGHDHACHVGASSDAGKTSGGGGQTLSSARTATLHHAILISWWPLLIYAQISGARLASERCPACDWSVWPLFFSAAESSLCRNGQHDAAVLRPLRWVAPVPAMALPCR